MRYVIYGAGAIGGVIGARLFQAGHDVTLIGRGAHLDAIRAGGLLFHAPEGEFRLPIAAVGHPRDLRFDADTAVFLTMKTQDTEAALRDLESAGGEESVLLCAQNGVACERMAARRFRRVYAMLVALPGTYLTPGEITGDGKPFSGVLHAGAFPGGTDDTIASICADLTAARLYSESDPAVMRLKYAKLLTNVGNAIQVITGGGWSDPDTVALRTAAADEARRCYRAAGIAWADDDEFAERVSRYYISLPSGVSRTVLSSSLQSVMRGNATIEADYLNGEIVLLGRDYGVETPVNAVLRRTAVRMAARGEPPGSMTAAGLWRLIEHERAGVPS